jgi:hypothetical protein
MKAKAIIKTMKIWMKVSIMVVRGAEDAQYPTFRIRGSAPVAPWNVAPCR